MGLYRSDRRYERESLEVPKKLEYTKDIWLTKEKSYTKDTKEKRSCFVKEAASIFDKNDWKKLGKYEKSEK